jgi:hypothetical protein
MASHGEAVEGSREGARVEAGCREDDILVARHLSYMAVILPRAERVNNTVRVRVSGTCRRYWALRQRSSGMPRMVLVARRSGARAVHAAIVVHALHGRRTCGHIPGGDSTCAHGSGRVRLCSCGHGRPLDCSPVANRLRPREKGRTRRITALFGGAGRAGVHAWCERLGRWFRMPKGSLASAVVGRRGKPEEGCALPRETASSLRSERSLGASTSCGAILRRAYQA